MGQESKVPVRRVENVDDLSAPDKQPPRLSMVVCRLTSGVPNEEGNERCEYPASALATRSHA